MGGRSAIEEVEARAMELTATDRASLVGLLVKSLVLPEDEILNAWVGEARRRDQEIGADSEAGIPAAEVLNKARASLS